LFTARVRRKAGKETRERKRAQGGERGRVLIFLKVRGAPTKCARGQTIKGEGRFKIARCTRHLPGEFAFAGLHRYVALRAAEEIRIAGLLFRVASLNWRSGVICGGYRSRCKIHGRARGPPITAIEGRARALKADRV